MNQRADKIEVIILSQAWTAGTQTGKNFVATRTVVNPIASLPLTDANEEQRKEAQRILRDKYHLHAKVVRSESMGGIDVLRVEDNGPFKDVEKLAVAQGLANPKAWKLNTITHPSGASEPVLNLFAAEMTELQIDYAQSLLREWGIESTTPISQSLGGHRVVRITGEAAIARLQECISTLRPDSTPPASKAGSPAPKL